ncbi:restriction endonuclease subunit S [Loigolactobacillus backii]|uniref:restriction endonuclease subunit S n=1 Tax=Loigolactobacillus backii TaxID=375175 RepID=UPI0007F06BA4|nr:restriction endonuclease subunit S [Loigolactobacillus backii]ANK68468.1 hypothetical protein AYR55_11940 [Loigolactobacillus backii]PIO88611.1 restriction endonuclease subunit S [Loigolactobacillus backii]
METKTVRLGDFATLVNEKCYLNEASRNTYVSTENLKPNRLGVFFPITKLPRTNKVNTFAKGDILIANIRPYFKKIWHANIAGTHSTDVLNIRSNSKQLLQSYLAVVLSDDRFFDYMMATSKGTKMPRGDKKAIMDFKFELPSFKDQIIISDSISIINQKIELNQQINKNLLKLGINIAIRTSNINKSTTCRISDMKDFLTVSDHVANGSFKTLKDNVTIVDKPDYSLFLRNTDLKRNLMDDKRWITKHSYDFLKKSHLYGGEVIISNVGDVGSVHRVPYLDEHMVAGNNVIFIQSADSWITDYLYLYFLSNIGQHALSTITSGSAQQKFNKTDFRAIELPIIPKNFVKKNLTPILKKIDSNRVEEDCLITLRDLLLPRLLSGEIDLSILEEVLKNAK